jgi:hypothetical protein
MHKLTTVALCGVLTTAAACAAREASPPPAMAPELATILVNYAALNVCACLFVSRRTLDSCKDDLDPAAKPLVSVTAAQERVTATLQSGASGSARYESGYGCVVEKSLQR